MFMDIKQTQKATFGAGCFWGVEAAFRKIPGVVDIAVGYMGGSLEVVEVVYDPKKVSYEELLNVFWNIHDPTQINMQGPDVGAQYRSVIFYHTEEQKMEAEKSKAELNVSGKLKKPVATAIEPASKFWRAEEYHQRYAEKHPGLCR